MNRLAEPMRTHFAWSRPTVEQERGIPNLKAPLFNQILNFMIVHRCSLRTEEA